jgi:hypothetical protein
MVNQTIRTMYQDPRFIHPIQYTFSSDTQCRADSKYLHMLLFVITIFDSPTTESSMQEFSMRALKGQGSGEMQTKAHTALKLLLLGRRLLDLRHLHLKMPQLQCLLVPINLWIPVSLFYSFFEYFRLISILLEATSTPLKRKGLQFDFSQATPSPLKKARISDTLLSPSPLPRS